MFSRQQTIAVFGFAFFLVLSSSVNSFELLSEGAMGSVSAVSANSAEDIVNVIGSTAAGLTTDDDYDELPFQENTSSQGDVSAEAVAGYVSDGYASEEVNEVKVELEMALTQEVEGWVSSLTDRQNVEVSYVEELPISTFEDNAAFIIPEVDIDDGIFDNNTNADDNTLYEISRINQTITVLNGGLDSIEYIVERQLERAATIAVDNGDSLGSGYVSNLRSLSNISIARVRE